MNDEIREIFDTKLYFDLEEEDYIKIKDYITNLQKEVRANNDLIPHFKNRVKELKKEITNLQEENERLKEENKCIFSKVNDDELLISNAMNYAEAQDYKSRVEKAVEQAKEKIKRYESYINDLKKGNYPSPTIRQERQELIFRIREQEDLLNILQNGSDDNG